MHTMKIQIPARHCKKSRRMLGRVILAALFMPSWTARSSAQPHDPPSSAAPRARFATFNVSMNRRNERQLLEELVAGNSGQAAQVAEIIQRVRPDVLLLNELDYDPAGAAAAAFHDQYLMQSQNGQPPITYLYRFVAPVNTGVDSGLDLDHDGQLGLAADAFGYGSFPGQYGMAIFSRYPIVTDAVRTFQTFLWKDLPNTNWPVDPDSHEHYYHEQARQRLRLSSKSHWDVPLQLPGRIVHFLVCHPTPPVFDGDEDRNGKRNFDEIRFWVEYLNAETNHAITDDAGRAGGLPADAAFVVAGDLNADPYDGDSRRDAISQLLQHPRVNHNWAPSSYGGVQATRDQAGVNLDHQGNPAHDTSDFDDQRSGNLRVDYVLPSTNLKLINSGVYWPANQRESRLIQCSDHRLVWIDVNCEKAGGGKG
jgi:endonuclease/exonuclease/phosphatase family metal-dependent hydrolase